jgi:class 3 adenylate cyclase/tetratricopeptide (TPR) repeat protein
MSCTTCGNSNPVGNRFCGGCGASLDASASAPASLSTQAESARSPADYTPKYLADKILQSKSAIEGERKQVTVLFADVKGSMDLAAQVDAEVWHSILDRFFKTLSEGVHRFEGTVNQYTGDGIMALFGAPIAHEDHAQRACYSALHLRDALRAYADELRRTQGVSLSTRIGINSGEVVVGKIGDDLRMDYTAQGHTVGLAQRMEQTAAADRANITASTARLVEGYFDLRDLGDFEIKGSNAPLRVYEIERVGALRTRLDSSRSRGFSKFVGREREMKSLEDALEDAIAGDGQVVGVVADAGTGKSRLCFEFVERCRARGIRVIEAHCPAHGKTVPNLPLLEMLRNIFGIGARDTDHEARRKIAGELMLLDETFQSLLPILFEFMGVADPTKPASPMSPEGRQQKLFGFVRHLVQARSDREPTVMLLDDLHWIDPGSDAFLAHSVEAAAHTRTLWLVNFRPEYHAEWMKKSFYQQLPLRPLGVEAIAALLRDLLGNDASVSALPARIHERTGGNPFFIEEVVQSLVENGSLEGSKGAYRLVTSDNALELPATVQNVLAARLDRLPDREKRLLQTASVIGKEFSGVLLERVVANSGRETLPDSDLADALAALGRAEFLFETSLYPEVEYAFKHPLTQEVAYTSQLTARRVELHASVARAIEQLHSDKLDEYAALLAYHWEQAGEALTAAHWHARAANGAGFDSPVDALRHWERVTELLHSASSSEEAVALLLRAAGAQLNFAWRLGMNRDRIDQIFAEGNAVAVERGDVTEQVRLHYGLSLTYSVGGDPRSAIPILEKVVALADSTGDPRLRWSARTPLDFAFWLVGDLAAALRMNDEQIELSEPDPGLGIEIVGLSTADSLWHRALILADLGRFEESKEALRQGVERVRHFGEKEMESWSDFWSTLILTRAGDTSAAMSMGRRAIESTEKIGSVVGRVCAYTTNGMACVLGKEWEAARESLEFALELGHVNQAGQFLETFAVAALAEAYLGLGRESQAREKAEEAVATALRMESRVGEIAAHLAQARVWVAFDGAAAQSDIESALDSAESLVRTTGALSYEPQILVERARLAELVSDPTGHANLLLEAKKRFGAMGATGHAERTAELIAKVSP